MAKVISTLFISADGVAEIDPDWHFPYFDENMGRAVTEDYDTSDVLLKPGTATVPLVADTDVLQFAHNGRYISDHFGIATRFDALVTVG